MFSLALLNDWLVLLPYRNMFGHALTVLIISGHVWNMPKHVLTCLDHAYTFLENVYVCLLKICLILDLKCREMHAWVMSGHCQKAQEIPWTCLEYSLLCLYLAMTCLELFWYVWTHNDSSKTYLDIYELCLVNDWWSCLDISETHRQ